MPKVLSLDKSLSVLEAVFQSKNGVGTRALEQQLGYNVATVHNIATTFCHRGYLRQDPSTKLFFPGTRLMLLGRHPSYLRSLTTAATAIVDEVAEQLKESVLLAFIEHGRILNLKYVASSQALRVHEPEDVTDRSYCMAIGKILLSSFVEQELEAYFRDIKLEQLTPHTITTPEDLRRELEKVREQGFAQTRDEYCEGISAVAVPIHDPWGSIIAGIAASAPTLRMQKSRQFKETLTTLQEAAMQIEKIWGEELHAESSKKKIGRKKKPA